MAKDRRTLQDESITMPIYRHLYSACWIGHPPGDPHEEPQKFTQTLAQRIMADSSNEWNLRFAENDMLMDKFAKGELTEVMETVEKLDELMKEFGVEEAIDGITSADDAVTEIDKRVEEFSDMTALEAIDEILTSEALTTFILIPPVANIPLALIPAFYTLLFGPSADAFFNNLDHFTLEETGQLEDFHYEEGLLMARISYREENAMEILERRHLRTGEKFRYLCCQRPTGEGSLMVSDILKDIRNERMPEYANAPIFMHGYCSSTIPDACQPSSRSVYELCYLFPIYGQKRCGWPYQSYVGLVPVPGLFDLIFNNLPIDMIAPRMIGLFTSAEIWWSKYCLSHCAVGCELIGSETIPPLPTESVACYIRYGMDRTRYPPSMIQSKRVYGEEARIRGPYPLPEKYTLSLDEAVEEIINARREHPEWLTDVKGFGN
ncbi:MAG: hypothetical protein SVM80_06455 [Halobacteriota archaeon]|nr:hypothetical protein [Halobacteriota archaeon]